MNDSEKLKRQLHLKTRDLVRWARENHLEDDALLDTMSAMLVVIILQAHEGNGRFQAFGEWVKLTRELLHTANDCGLFP